MRENAKEQGLSDEEQEAGIRLGGDEWEGVLILSVPSTSCDTCGCISDHHQKASGLDSGIQ